MISHVAFIEVMGEFETPGTHEEWRETLAGLLVLRMFHLWMVDPAIAHRATPSARFVRSLVMDLPESTPARPRLIAILDSLRPRGPVRPKDIAAVLESYAAVLASRAKWKLAREVYGAARLHCPRRDAAGPPRDGSPAVQETV